MANEARVVNTLQIKNLSLNWRTPAGGFSADVSGTFGPSPGAVVVSASGTDIDFSKLTTPGLCEITNLEDPDTVTSFVTLGVYDPSNDAFTPVDEIHPGETWTRRWSRFVGRESTGTGTGPGAYNNTIQLRSSSGTSRVAVSTFDA